MKLSAAISSEINNIRKPVITGYDIGKILYALYQGKAYKGEVLAALKRDTPTRQNYLSLIRELANFSVLRSGNIIKHPDVFEIFSVASPPSSGEVVCSVDPFAYVSHLSAMEYHGLTDQFPKMFFVSSPKSNIWRDLATKQMEKDFGDALPSYFETGLPTLSRVALKKVGKHPVNIYSSVHYDAGAYISVKDKELRVSSLGRTFLDMIRSPDLCGGIYHVLDVYKESAKRYLRLIVDETDRNGSLIDQTRVGYILEERLGLSEPRIEKWKKKVQRGGSRKLVADGEYSPIFSEAWCLSINIEESLDE